MFPTASPESEGYVMALDFATSGPITHARDAAASFLNQTRPQGMCRIRDEKSRGGAAQYAGRLPQILHQPHGVFRLAKRRSAPVHPGLGGGKAGDSRVHAACFSEGKGTAWHLGFLSVVRNRPFAQPALLQESLSVTARLNTGLPGKASLMSAMKYP